jgi:hypothetical protein
VISRKSIIEVHVSFQLLEDAQDLDLTALAHKAEQLIMESVPPATRIAVGWSTQRVRRRRILGNPRRIARRRRLEAAAETIKGKAN